jgi:citrate lyase subunit beta/citryl-CoA lyase
VDLSLLRSLLFAPAAEEAKLRKALGSPADAVIADLEDGTAPDEKDAARGIVEALFAGADAGRVRGLRVNAPDTEWFEADLELAGRLALDFLMLPKATPDAVAALGAAGPPVLAIVETASGLRLAYETAAAARVFALALGSHDLGADLRTEPRPDGLELLYARSTLVTVSAAARRRPPLDTVYLDVRDPDGLEAESVLARSLGFRGKLCIHPGQLETVSRVFAPGEEELEWARRVLEAYEQGLREGRGAVALDGKMVDMPIVRRAERLLAEAGVRADSAAGGPI